jgi:RloB-like protein
MSPSPRKPRPLARDAASLRDDRLFIVACDDTYAPKQYFGFFRIPRVQIYVVPTTDGTSAAAHVLERLGEIDHEEDDELWMLLDTDHCAVGSHLASFTAALSMAKQKGVNVALSRPSFELWLLLHHAEEGEVTAFSSSNDVEKAIRAKLGQYNKTNLKREHYPVEKVALACQRAEKLDAITGGEIIPATNTSRIYLVWRSIAAKASPSQLSETLKQIPQPK